MPTVILDLFLEQILPVTLSKLFKVVNKAAGEKTSSLSRQWVGVTVLFPKLQLGHFIGRFRSREIHQ